LESLITAIYCEARAGSRIGNQVQATHVGVTNRGNAPDLPASRPEQNTSAATSLRGWARITESPSFCCSDLCCSDLCCSDLCCSDLWMSRTRFINGLGGDQWRSPRSRLPGNVRSRWPKATDRSRVGIRITPHSPSTGSNRGWPLVMPIGRLIGANAPLHLAQDDNLPW